MKENADQNQSEYRHFLRSDMDLNTDQSTFTCSKLTIETLEQGMKYVQS